MRARVQGKVPVVTIENGIDVQRVTQGARLRSELLPDLPPDAFVVMQVGASGLKKTRLSCCAF